MLHFLSYLIQAPVRGCCLLRPPLQILGYCWYRTQATYVASNRAIHYTMPLGTQRYLHRRELVVSALRHFLQVFVEHEVELLFVVAASAGHLLAG